MDETLFTQFSAACCNIPCKKTLHELSKSKEGDCCVGSGDASGSILAIDIESLINKWMDVPRRLASSPCQPCPSMVDAIYVDENTWYLIEFKYNKGEPIGKFRRQLTLKIYDTVLQLVEHGLRRVGEIRNNDWYIVVALRTKGMTKEQLENADKETKKELKNEAIDGFTKASLNAPWENEDLIADCRLSNYNSVLYKRALTLTPEQFNRFVTYKSWKNN